MCNLPSNPRFFTLTDFSLLDSSSANVLEQIALVNDLLSFSGQPITHPVAIQSVNWNSRISTSVSAATLKKRGTGSANPIDPGALPGIAQLDDDFFDGLMAQHLLDVLANPVQMPVNLNHNPMVVPPNANLVAANAAGVGALVPQPAAVVQPALVLPVPAAAQGLVVQIDNWNGQNHADQAGNQGGPRKRSMSTTTTYNPTNFQWGTNFQMLLAPTPPYEFVPSLIASYFACHVPSYLD